MTTYSTPVKPQSLIKLINDILSLDQSDESRENVLTEKITKIVRDRSYIVNETDGEDHTPLHLACKYKKQTIANLLILNSVSNINAISKTGKTALMYSCIEGMDQTTELLLSKSNTQNIMHQDSNVCYALAYSCFYGNEEISLKIMEKTNSIIFNDLFVIENVSYNLSMVVCKRGFAKMLDELFKRERRLKTYLLNSREMTAISYALFSGNEEMVLNLLKNTNIHHYKQIFAYENTEYTYFSAAARLKLFSVVEFLAESQKNNENMDILKIHHTHNGKHFFDFFFDKSFEHLKIKLSGLVDLVADKKKKMSEEEVDKMDKLALKICDLYVDEKLFISLNKGNTVLSYACRNGYKKTILYLLEGLETQSDNEVEKYLNIQHLDTKKTVMSILYTKSANWAFTGVVRAGIIKKFRPFYERIHYELKDDGGNTILMQLAINGYFDVIYEILNSKNENAINSLDIINKRNGNSVLNLIHECFAGVFGSPTVINSKEFKEYKEKSREAKRLCEKIVELKPELLTHKNKEKTTSLMVFASIYDSVDLMRLCVGKVDINAVNESNMTALLYSTYLKNNNAIYLLSLDGIQYDNPDLDESAFSVSCFSNDDAVALEFLKKPDLDLEFKDGYGSTPLMHACLSGFTRVALEIIERNPNTIYDMNTLYLYPYHYAIMSKNSEIIQKIEQVHREKYPDTDDVEKNMENSFRKGGSFYYNGNDTVFDIVSGEDIIIHDYLEESPDNICFEIIEDTAVNPNYKKIYGLTTRKNIIDSLDYSTSTNTYFYGCKKAMHKFMEQYGSSDLDIQEEAEKNLDLDNEYIYMQPVAGINGLINPDMLRMLSLDINKNQYFGLIKNENFNYESIINRLIIVSNSYYSTSTTHCEPMGKPAVYCVFPMLSDPSKKRKRGYLSPSIENLKIASPKQNVVKVKYMDAVKSTEIIYEIEVKPGTNISQLRELFLQKLVENGKIGEDVRQEDVKIRFFYLGKLYSVDKDGDKIVSEIPNFDYSMAFNTMVNILKPSLAKGGMGKKTRKQHRIYERKTRHQKTRGLKASIVSYQVQ